MNTKKTLDKLNDFYLDLIYQQYIDKIIIPILYNDYKDTISLDQFKQNTLIVLPDCTKIHHSIFDRNVQLNTIHLNNNSSENLELTKNIKNFKNILDNISINIEKLLDSSEYIIMDINIKLYSFFIDDIFLRRNFDANYLINSLIKIIQKTFTNIELSDSKQIYVKNIEQNLLKLRTECTILL